MTTPLPRQTAYIAKFVILTKYIFVAQALMMLCVVTVGKLVFRFTQPIPANMLTFKGGYKEIINEKSATQKSL